MRFLARRRMVLSVFVFVLFSAHQPSAYAFCDIFKKLFSAPVQTQVEAQVAVRVETKPILNADTLFAEDKAAVAVRTSLESDLRANGDFARQKRGWLSYFDLLSEGG